MASKAETQMAEMMERLAAAERRAAEAEARALKAEAAKAKGNAGISFKVSENAKALSIYGLQSRPVTLYAGQWLRLLQHVDALKAFITANKAELAWKDGQTPAIDTPAVVSETQTPAAE